jgi:uncharacterized caspase-like protein
MEPSEAQRRSRGNCECMFAALALYSVAWSNACAGNELRSAEARHNADLEKAVREQMAAASFPAPFAFTAPGAQTPVFSSTEFRPRKSGLPATADTRSEDPVIDAPMLRDTSIARALSEAKTQDRVRLLTLWQSRASSLSLQTGRHGAPSLQWSTPWMHRDNQSRGVFDRLLPAAPSSFGNLVRGGSSRPAGATATVKSADFGAPINSR